MLITGQQYSYLFYLPPLETLSWHVCVWEVWVGWGGTLTDTCVQ
jgi:hypothetical protein